jgi:hypothetical protein
MLPSLLVPSYSEAVSSDPNSTSSGGGASGPILHPVMARELACVCNATKGQLLELDRKADARFLVGCPSMNASCYATTKLVSVPVSGSEREYVMG